MPIILHSGIDIAGDDYSEFLDMALDWFGFFSLVWRDEDVAGLLDSAVELRRDLDRHEANRRRASHWPGSSVSSKSPVATIISYRLDPVSRQILARPKSLFAWRPPDFPEDLAFYERDGRLAFATKSFSRLAWAIDLDFGHCLPKHLGFEAEDYLEAGAWGGFEYVA